MPPPRARRCRTTDRGGSALEYAAVFLLVAVLAGTAIATAPHLGGTITSSVEEMICTGAGGADCGTQEPNPAAAPAEHSAPDPARDPGPLPDLPGPGEDPAAQPLVWHATAGNGVAPTLASATEVTGSEHRGQDDQTEFTEDGTAGTDRDEITDTGLGDPVEGDAIDGDQQPPDWQAPAPHNDHDAVDPTDADREAWRTWNTRAWLATLAGYPNAGRNMRHFLGNSGEPLEQDVDRLLREDPQVAYYVEEHQDRLIEEAVQQAQDSGATGPVTFPITTDWALTWTLSQDEDGTDWDIALGTFNYSLTGTITVEPGDDGTWSFDITTTMHIRDQYDWHGADDTNLDTDVPHVGSVDDEELAQLVRAGLAREFTAYGTSRPSTRRGTYDQDLASYASGRIEDEFVYPLGELPAPGP